MKDMSSSNKDRRRTKTRQIKSQSRSTKDKDFPKEVFDLKCPECESTMVLRKYSKYGPFYGCSTYPKCLASHGTHPDGAPLGIPADRITKRARIEAHKVFDQLWKDNGPMTRKDAYSWLRRQMKMTKEECHIGKFDEESCNKIIDFVAEELKRRGEPNGNQ